MMIAARGTLALMTRSLRTEARSVRTYTVRLALTGLIFFGLIMSYTQSMWMGAPGLHLFGWIMGIGFALLTLAGLSYFATVISEEREEMTLGLLRMTRLNSISIILGKSGTRLLATLVLLLAQLPFTLMAITLGGVGVQQIIAGYLMLAAYAIALAGVALLWSVLCRRSRNASATMLIALLCFFVGPWLGKALIDMLVQQGQLAGNGAVGQSATTFFDWLIEASPISRMRVILGTGFSDSAIGFQVITNVAGGAVCFVLAWLAFEYLHRDEVPAGPGGAGTSRKRLARRRRRSRRAWRAALLWKDFRYMGSGIAGWIGRLVVYGAVVGAIYVLSHWKRPFDPTELGDIMVWTAIAGLMIEASALAAHVFRDEINWRTLSGIMILPMSVGKLAYAKITGCLLLLIPAALLFCLGAMLTPHNFKEVFGHIITEPEGWLAIAICVFFVHLVAFLSLYLKWGALAAALGLLLMGWVVVGGVFGMLLAAAGAGIEAVNAFVVCIVLILAGLTVGLHLLCGVRLQQLAGQ